LQGNPGRRPIAPEVEMPGLPVMPTYLRRQRRAATIWNELVEQLTAVGLASAVDALALGMLCSLLARFEQGRLTASELAQLRGLMAGFGLTGPSSRSGLRVERPAPPMPEDEKYLRARGLRPGKAEAVLAERGLLTIIK
jgi:phage terminase small subunit